MSLPTPYMPLATRRTPSVADYSDEDLLRRAVRNARDPNKRGRSNAARWVHVMEVFALGSTYAAQLCRRFDLDPDEMVR